MNNGRRKGFFDAAAWQDLFADIEEWNSNWRGRSSSPSGISQISN